MKKQILIVLPITAYILLATGCTSNSLQRHVAEWRFGPEQLTNKTAAAGVAQGGDVIYNKTFPLPSNQNTLFVTLSSTGDTHGGAASWFSALVNGVACNRGNEGASGAPSGWVPLQKHRDDLHDNGITYTWCCREGVRPGVPNRVQLKMASSIAGEPVFIERSHFYIDSVQAELCTEAEKVPTSLATETMKMPKGHQNQG